MDRLLIEIGFEELPAAPLNNELPNLEQKYAKTCAAFGFDSPFSFNFTPRRFVFFHESFPSAQADRVENLYGPPVESAFKDGAPTQAAVGFAVKCGVEVADLSRAMQKGREVLSYEKRVAGRPTAEVIGDLLSQFLGSLNLAKTMRWGSSRFLFSRPVRSLMVLHGSRTIECELFGVKSNSWTLGHRTHSYDPQPYDTKIDFESFLASCGVILNPKKRREKILADFAKIESENSTLSIERDLDLLEEVIAITENPTAHLGRFDELYLELPKEVIITSMKTNQRYFPVFEAGKLTNRFVVVSNALCDDFSAVIAGNEKVLRPRLSDALFFWQNDLANGLKPEPLKLINYAQGLGTIYDKTLREIEVAKKLSNYLNIQDENIDRAASLAKCDLATQMVYEFTELQGVMGMHYAKKAGENSAVSTAIYEQYMPLGEGSPLPKTQTGALLSIATKIDTLMALFSIGNIPSGSKDPLALRRAAWSIAAIALDRGWHFDLPQLLKELSALYKPFDLSSLSEFFKARLYTVFDAEGTNASILSAVLASGENDLLRISQKYAAIVAVSSRADFRDNLALFKRVANILKGVDLGAVGAVDTALFADESEGALLTAFSAIGEQDDRALLLALFGLKPHLDRYFEKVIINADDPKVRSNRLALMAAIYNRFLRVADIKEISF
ncbi:glycine--tRNA ligase beta subunit [Campylobacterota bacterium]|nr:glycine--tRNA ligase beta subunit [Campylobacterota bacterium]